MGYQCRCMARVSTPHHPTRKSRECGKRRTLRMKPEHYKVQPMCECGARKWGLDNYRRKKELPNQENCYCNGLTLCSPTSGKVQEFHRRGSKGCVHHPDFQGDGRDGWEEGRE